MVDVTSGGDTVVVGVEREFVWAAIVLFFDLHTHTHTLKYCIEITLNLAHLSHATF